MYSGPLDSSKELAEGQDVGCSDSLADCRAGACPSRRPSARRACVSSLPTEVMHRIFREVIAADPRDFYWMATLSLVSRRWNALCQSPVLWAFVVRRSFVVYPLIQRLDNAAPLDEASQGVMDVMHKLGTWAERESAAAATGGDPDPVSPLLPPGRETVREAIGALRHYRARRQHYEYVQRRRSLVLHLFLSAMLLCLSVAITAAMCAAERVPVPYVCTKEMSFASLWLCYMCIVAMIVSNVVMQAHFEPQPLLLRLQRNRLLICASAAVVVLGIVDVMVPTVLIQVNLSRDQRFSWLWCGTTVILSFCAWQCYALACIMPDARAHLRYQLTSLNVKEGIQFVVMNVPNAFPLLFAAAAFCALQYVQGGSRLYVFLGGVPIVVSLGVLALVFLMDYLALQRTKDLSVALCLFTAMFFPLSLLWWDFRGWCLLPLAGSVLGFFISHTRYVVRQALDEMRAVEQRNRAAIAEAPRASPTPAPAHRTPEKARRAHDNARWRGEGPSADRSYHIAYEHRAPQTPPTPTADERLCQP